MQHYYEQHTTAYNALLIVAHLIFNATLRLRTMATSRLQQFSLVELNNPDYSTNQFNTE